MRIFQGIPQFPALASDRKRELYSYEQTIVIRDANLNDKVNHCEVIEVYEKKEVVEVLNKLKSQFNLKVEKIDMVRMMALVRDCDSVDNLDSKERANEVPKIKSRSPNALINGIFPGTKWCGLGNIANGFHDLGKLHNVDRCCRSHDFCPIKVLKKDQRYNLTNTAFYTKSHCLCDETFYDCLKKDNGWSAIFIGNIYFNAASPNCIKGVPEQSKETMKFIPATKKW
ncbi:phospholipase A2 hemilipin-like [Phymastichus coffea]|uniref:phospholipase A2 hemilipin-like n=1 Tax=Phymastichus coffea TaxID=108790 RepID=UPI00273CEEF0|nr:phospholipase A2 hemilipin-like [Phymastichus coffea]